MESNILPMSASPEALEAPGLILPEGFQRKGGASDEEALRDQIMPLIRGLGGFIDNHGNAGVGLVAKIGTCSECGRTNKVVGPRDEKPEERTCFGGCDSQKGPTPWQTKVARMGWSNDE